jgi:hypothetical protein
MSQKWIAPTSQFIRKWRTWGYIQYIIIHQKKTLYWLSQITDYLNQKQPVAIMKKIIKKEPSKEKPAKTTKGKLAESAKKNIT